MAMIKSHDGYNLHCYADDFLFPWEQPTPVVLTHGFARHGLFWNPWVPLLGSERRVYRPDVRGFGDSDVMPDDYKYNVVDLLTDIVRILDQLRLESVHWVGESSGGTLGIALAANHPERVKSLVLMDAPAHPYSDPTTWEDNSIDCASPQEAILKHGLEEWCRITLGRRLDLDRSSPELQRWYCEQTGRNANRSAVGWSDINVELDLRDLLPKIKVPTLILAGQKSPIVGKQQQSMAERIPGAHLHLFEDYGHGLSLTATEQCVAEVKALWAEVEGS
jgi:3-oxoadipate enol-lactonase